MQRYANDTKVDPVRTRAEIERTLQRWGIAEFISGVVPGGPVIAFKYKGLTVRIQVQLPLEDDPEVVYTPAKGLKRSAGEQKRVYEQLVRQRWRAMLLLLKAKLESIELGIASFEGEFLPYMVLPSGETVTERLMPEIYHALESGESFPMLPPGKL